MASTCHPFNMIVDIDSTTGIETTQDGEYVMGPIATSCPVSVTCGDCGAELELENSGRSVDEAIRDHLK